MADQPSSTTAKESKKRGMVKFFRDLIKQPKSANNPASQSISAQVSVSSAFGASAFGAHDPVRGNDAGSAEPTASSKYIVSILVLSTTTWTLQMAT